MIIAKAILFALCDALVARLPDATLYPWELLIRTNKAFGAIALRFQGQEWMSVTLGCHPMTALDNAKRCGRA